MTRIETIRRLRAIATKELSPLIDRDYRYLMMPDHGNTGDIFIYFGERAFLKTTGFNCLEETTMRSFASRNPEIGQEDLLVFRGGGWFGDIWPNGPHFLLDVLSSRKDNPVLILPQSVHFSQNDALEEMRRAIAAHGKTTLCVRDRASFRFAEANFDCRVVLAPDSAFFWDPGRDGSSGSGDLLITRNDRESPAIPDLQASIGNPAVTAADWPSIDSPDCEFRIMCKLRDQGANGFDVFDRFARDIWCRHVANRAIRLFRPFGTVWSTRLHGAILALLMDKRTIMIDNRFGKSKNFYDTWLTDCDGVRMQDDGH